MRKITVAKGVTDQPFARTPDTKKPVSSDQDTGLRAAGATDAPAGVSLYGFCKEDTDYGIGAQFFKFAFYGRKAHTGSQNIVD